MSLCNNVVQFLGLGGFIADRCFMTRIGLYTLEIPQSPAGCKSERVFFFFFFFFSLPLFFPFFFPNNPTNLQQA